MLSRRLWGNARERLGKDDPKVGEMLDGFVGKQTVMSPGSSHLDREAVARVISHVEEMRKVCDERKWKLRLVNGRPIILREVAVKIISYLHNFEEVGDFVAGLDAKLSLPWAAVKMLIAVCMPIPITTFFFPYACCLLTFCRLA